MNLKEMQAAYGDSSLNAETELMELELGWRAAFDLYHLDDVMFEANV